MPDVPVPDAPPVQTLQPLRFQCTACGACCHGVQVELEGDETARIARYAAEMGIDDPIVDGMLRHEGGRCVFLQPDDRCGIHARYGGQAKPLTCQQFPYVLLDTADGRRAGIDPSSFHILSSWQTAPLLEDPVGEARRSRLDPRNRQAEQVVIAWCSDDATVASVLGHLCAASGHAPALPPGFASRLVTRLKKMRLDVLLQARDAGPAPREALQPLVEGIDRWDPADPPGWPALGPTEDAFAVEVARRMVFLRLATRIPLVQGVALLTLSGAVALGWACPEPKRFGPALAAWSRLIRGGSFWQSLTPSPQAMQWLAHGDPS